MKRVSFNLDQSSSYDEEARIRQRHQSLLQDYLELQKEFVSKKKKLQSANLKRKTLLAEVRFLRLRQAYLEKIQTSKIEFEKLQNSDAQPEISAESERNFYSANGALLKSHTRVSDANRVSDRDEAIREAMRMQKKHKNGLINGKRAAKKKISVQDQIVLEAKSE